MVLRLFLDKGEAMLCEQNTYPHIYESLVHPTGLRTVPVAMDEQGMLPGALRETLEGFAARGERAAAPALHRAGRPEPHGCAGSPKVKACAALVLMRRQSTCFTC